GAVPSVPTRRSSDLEDPAVDQQRRAFLAARGVEVGEPGEAELADVLGVDLVERAVALLRIVAPVGDPVGGISGGVDQPLGVDPALGSAIPASRQRQRRARGDEPFRKSHSASPCAAIPAASPWFVSRTYGLGFPPVKRPRRAPVGVFPGCSATSLRRIESPSVEREPAL